MEIKTEKVFTVTLTAREVEVLIDQLKQPLNADLPIEEDAEIKKVREQLYYGLYNELYTEF